MRPNIFCVLVLAVAGVVANPPRMAAQLSPGTIAGVVRDIRGPLSGALVRLDPDRGSDSLQLTDAAGRFRFRGVRPGAHVLRAMKVGYSPRDLSVNLGDAGLETNIELVALPPTLDTQRVVASRSSIVGTVVAAAEWRPVSHASLLLQSTSFAAESDTAGRFAFDRVPVGAYVLFAKAPGFLPRMLSLVVPPHGAVEVAVEMRTPAMDPNRERAALMAEFNVRTRTAVLMNSALIPRQELMANEKELLSFAISTSPSFLKRGLRFTTECLFINGEPAAAAALDDIRVSQVEAVEVYGAEADVSQTLKRRWGIRPGCGLRTLGVETRRKRAPLDRRAVVQAVVVWLRN